MEEINKADESSLFDIVCKSMVLAQNEKLIADDKKQLVMNILQNSMSVETFTRYQPILSIMIDGIKYLAKSKILNDLKNSKYKCC